MNKDELIEILQKRSQDSLYNDNGEAPATEAEHEKYISKIKFRRKSDKKIYPLVSIIAFLLIIIIILAFKEPSNPLEDDSNYLLKSTITFKDLPANIQENYVFKAAIEDRIKNTEETQKSTIMVLEKELETAKKEIANLEEKIELVQIGQNDAHIEIQKNRSKRYNAIGCYEKDPGSHFIYNACKAKVKKFLDAKANQTAKSYEIIAVMGPKDKEYIKGVLNGTKHSKASRKQLEQYLAQGLARKRVLEAAWYIKNKLGKKPMITYVNYIAETASKRGFTVRAYK